MPDKDGTGPTGEGPAGRMMGPCSHPKEERELTEGADAGNPEGQGGKPRGRGRGHCGGRQHHGHGRMRRCCEEI
ncbi:hypothetical protein MCP_0531 [Methanocella paludicola SANAE]|uniref:Uncharacterized protein n=1 Tax=Methanocella paludicola (strain DSM 17711 / JCM 13418 / NBRC 101707 / SANAE) TaxID=304371 RepID=D1YVY1_METPS|nr:DUF5320 domain-containing protein [Methanocella paludicola]BAI60603.1 hypothetical protein MCP_0531 [Methanocella paludicola SANAE]